ncbi:hypothetical protein B0T14DRAFT_492383 [Immersiella caudata]|uniref:Uncharacterized protein n=1 Tax=Immersiella caudata TaxID=314043 RepID=A0AA39X2A3_9PEZI|nr:hypothetical protein B0T14DRAFT_492383 [Immersiella caudata]
MTRTFASIPSEIRVLIYTHLLVSSDPAIIVSGEDVKKLSFLTHSASHPPPTLIAFPASAPSSAVLRTCKMAYREGLELLYSKNVFQFPELLNVGSGQSIAHMDRFLERIGSTNAGLIRHIRVPVPRWFVAHKEYVRRLEWLQQSGCPQLRSLELCFSGEHCQHMVSHEEGRYDGEGQMRKLEWFLSDLNFLSTDRTLLTFSFQVKVEQLKDPSPVMVCARERLERAAPDCRVQAVKLKHTLMFFIPTNIGIAMEESAYDRYVCYKDSVWRREIQEEDELTERGWAEQDLIRVSDLLD